jgi:RNA polymerase sigma-70 factor, ECF subfamily
MDPELVIRAQRGDAEAFASLAVACGDRLHAIAHRILRDVDLAEDATQQALLAIWQNLPMLRDPARFDAWSYRLLVNACYDEGHRRRVWSPSVLVAHDEPTVPDAIGQVHDRDQLERGFRQLSIEHRAVVVLHTYLGLTLEEIAEALGTRPGTIRSRLHYAVRAMRAALDADERTVPGEVTP